MNESNVRKDEGVWLADSPFGEVISFQDFSLTENEDGTITVNQPIYLSNGTEIGPWELVKNVWKEIQ